MCNCGLTHLKALLSSKSGSFLKLKKNKSVNYKVLGNEEIIHLKLGLLFTQLSQYTHIVQFSFLIPKIISLFPWWNNNNNNNNKGSTMSTHFTSWNKDAVVHVFTRAATMSSGVLTLARKDNYLKPKKHSSACVCN